MIPHVSERELSLAGINASRGVTGSAPALLACRALNPFGGNSSASAKDQRVATTDQSRGVSGSKNKLLTDEATDLSENRGQIGGLSIATKDGNVTIESSDPELLTVALDRIANLSESSQAALANAQTANISQVQSLIDYLSTLAENKQTEGESGQSKTALWVILGVLLLLAWVFKKG